MSNIAIKGATTGTGTFTIESPATNTDRTLTLPDEAGTVLTSGSPLTSVPGAVTEVDQWFLTTTLTNPGDADITANLDPVYTLTGLGRLGTGMSKDANGIFTFPSTGLWLVRMEAHGVSTGDTSGYLSLNLTTGGSYTERSRADFGVANSADPVRSVSACQILVDITDTSTHKVKFSHGSMSATSLFGDASLVRTNFTFIRVGDT